MEAMLSMLVGMHPAMAVALAALGALVVVGQAYVAITPSQDDDAWYGRLEEKPVVGALLKAVKAFAPIQRK